MSSKKETTATKDEARPALVPKLRFPEFRDAAGWESEKVDDLVVAVTPPKKLPTSMYASSGTFPIIDQSQSDICGWTDDEEALIQESLPLIVFGDHTCILKLVARPFAQGADGIKILKTHSRVGAPYLYQFLSYRPVVTEEYKRHYSILKEKTAFFPELKSGEQQRIAECLSSVDELMAAQARKVDALKTHKKGLMQQLFPREGEIQPRLRFPRFRDAGAWEEKKLGSFCKVGDIDHKMPPSVLDGIPYVMTGDFFGINGINFENAKKISEEDYEKLAKKIKPELGDIAIARYASVGAVRYIETSTKFVISYSCAIIKCGKSDNSRYLYYALQSDAVQSKIDLEINPSSQKNIGIDSIKELTVILPPFLEQQEIAECLATVDALITAEAHKLEALKTHKKGLMQQLFPSPEAAEA